MATKKGKKLTDSDSSLESKMDPKPEYEDPSIKGSELLKGKVAIITGGDSGIGRAISVAFAREGADVAIVYNSSDSDANLTHDLVTAKGQKCLLLKGDIAVLKDCEKFVKKTKEEFGSLDILVNNAAEQHPQTKFEDVTEKQLVETFSTNVFGFFLMTKAALPHLKKGSVILNTSSVTAYRGSPGLIDYSATKGALVSFTRSLSGNLAKKGIRVNMVAPGPIWTPLIPSTFNGKDVKDFGKDTPMERPGQPYEVAECFVFLASGKASYITGQCIHPNGGEIVNA